MPQNGAEFIAGPNVTIIRDLLLPAVRARLGYADLQINFYDDSLWLSLGNGKKIQLLSYSEMADGSYKELFSSRLSAAVATITSLKKSASAPTVAPHV